jgi:hypothetical protein
LVGYEAILLEFPVVSNVVGNMARVDEAFCGGEDSGGYEAVGGGEGSRGEELFDFEGGGERRGLQAGIVVEKDLAETDVEVVVGDAADLFGLFLFLWDNCGLCGLCGRGGLCRDYA